MPYLDLPVLTRAVDAAEDESVMEFIASTDEVDRAGDVFEQNFDLTALKKAPVFCWMHRTYDLPLGKILKVWKDKAGDVTRTIIRVKFVSGDLYPFADTVRRFYLAKVLTSVSAGFRPLSRVSLTDDQKKAAGMPPWGERYNRSELFEVSAVVFPMNTSCTVYTEAKTKGFDLTLDSCESLLPPEANRVKVREFLNTDHGFETNMDSDTSVVPVNVNKDLDMKEVIARLDKLTSEFQTLRGTVDRSIALSEINSILSDGGVTPTETSDDALEAFLSDIDSQLKGVTNAS